MEMEQHHNSLAGTDVRKTLTILRQDLQRALHIGNAPMPWKVAGSGVYRSNGGKIDKHGHSPEIFHYLNIDLNRLFAQQYTGKHGNILLGKGTYPLCIFDGLVKSQIMMAK